MRPVNRTEYVLSFQSQLQLEATRASERTKLLQVSDTDIFIHKYTYVYTKTHLCVCICITHIIVEKSVVTVPSTAQELQKALLLFVDCICRHLYGVAQLFIWGKVSLCQFRFICMGVITQTPTHENVNWICKKSRVFLGNLPISTSTIAVPAMAFRDLFQPDQFYVSVILNLNQPPLTLPKERYECLDFLAKGVLRLWGSERWTIHCFRRFRFLLKFSSSIGEK